MSLWQFTRTMNDSSIAAFEADAYDQDIIVRDLLWRRAFIINEPRAIKHVLVDNAENYRKSEMLRRLLEPGLGHGLLTSDGPTWRQHRRMMAPSFGHRSVVGYAPIVTQVACALLENWSTHADGATVDIVTEMLNATLQIISKAIFSSDSDAVVDTVEQTVTRYLTNVRPNILDILGMPAWVTQLPRFVRGRMIMAKLNRSIDRLWASRARASNSPDDLLARLITAVDGDTVRMSLKEVRDEVATIFMAGHETTAMTLAWTWYLLSQHPLAEAKLHREIDSVLGGRDPHYDDLANLRYTRMVIEESMRLYPPAHTFSRQAIGADHLLGHRIPPGSTVVISPWLLHRRPSLWQNPDRFEPERFGPENILARDRFAYLPFGAGPRVCIGMAFAMTEAMLILTAIAQRYRLQLSQGHRVEPRGLITLRPRDSLRMTLHRR